jgi:hypothetical protein
LKISQIPRPAGHLLLTDIDGAINNGDTIGHYAAAYTTSSSPSRITVRHGNKVTALMAGGNAMQVNYDLMTNIDYTGNRQPWNVYFRKDAIPVQ